MKPGGTWHRTTSTAFGPSAPVTAVDQLADAGEVAFAGIIGRNIGRDIDHVACAEIGEHGGEGLRRSVGAHQVVEIWLAYRQFAGA